MATNKTRIKIRHGSTTPTTGTNGLLPYELGWDGSHLVLYINNNGGIRQVNSESTLGIPLVSGDNIDTLAPGIYYSGGSATSETLNGTLPNGDKSGFRLEVIRGYGTNFGAQIAYDSTDGIKIRKNSNNGSDDFTGLPWQTIITSTNIGSYTTVSNTWTAGTTAGPTIKTTVNGVSGTAVAIPAASKTASGVVTTGAQSFLGRKTFGFVNRDAYYDTGTASRYGCNTQIHNAAGNLVAEYWYDIGDATNVTAGRWGIRAYSPNSTANATTTGHHETFYLPNVTTGRTEDDSYMIITTKNPADLGYYLPLAGGIMSDEKAITFQITRKKAGGGGWAYTPLRMIDNTSTNFFNIGVYGSANTLSYAFIGANSYDSAANARVYPNGTIQAGGCAVIRDSGTTNRRIFLTTSASVPSGAVAGDIVLVKV